MIADEILEPSFSEKIDKLKAEASSKEWIESVLILVHEDEGYHIEVALSGTGARNAGRALHWANKALFSLARGRLTYVRVIPECDVFVDFERKVDIVKSYVRFTVLPQDGDMIVMRDWESRTLNDYLGLAQVRR